MTLYDLPIAAETDVSSKSEQFPLVLPPCEILEQNKFPQFATLRYNPSKLPIHIPTLRNNIAKLHTKEHPLLMQVKSFIRNHDEDLAALEDDTTLVNVTVHAQPVCKIGN